MLQRNLSNLTLNGASQIRRSLDYGVTRCIMNVVTVEVSDYKGLTVHV